MKETNTRRILSLILSVVMCFSLCFGSVFTVSAAETTETYGSFSVTTDDHSGLSYADNLLTISAGGTYTISGGSTSSDTIVVTASNSEVMITLDDVSITSSSASPLEINSTQAVTIKLSGDNVLKATASGYAGLQKTSDDNLLTITSADGDGETTGTLEATGGSYSAGIGGGCNYSSSTVYADDGNNITISGGTITATGGSYGAGIGGGGYYLSANSSSCYAGDGNNITILGGTVTATGGSYCAGIGGGGCYVNAYYSNGYAGDGNNIIISDGTVTATGGNYAPGIGSGNAGVSTFSSSATSGSSSNITISNGTVTASGGREAPGIGSTGTAEYITISNGTVTASGGIYGAGIGGFIAKYITISGGTVIAAGYGNGGVYSGAGIGGNGSDGKASYITISGGNVTASSEANNAAIGGGAEGADHITISGGVVKATSSGCAIGASGTATDINISPNTNKVIKARYEDGGTYTDYTKETDILETLNSTQYFDSYEEDLVYTLSAEIAGLYTDSTIDSSVTENFNTNDEIAVNIMASCTMDSNVGSLQFEFDYDSDLFTLEKVITNGSVDAVINGKAVSMTDLSTDINSSGKTVATAIIKVNSDITTTEDAEIGFSESGKNYLTPTGEMDEIVPELEGTAVNLYNLKLTFAPGDNAAFGTDDSTTAYVRYDEAGLYTDNTYATEFTIPTPTANTGYRLAAGTADEPLWSDGTNTYADNDAVKAAQFTADTALTVQTVAQFAVTLKPADSTQGTLYFDFGGTGTKTAVTSETNPVTVDVNTTLDDFNFSFTTADNTAYVLTGFTVYDGDTSEDVAIADFADTAITKAVTLTPIVESSTFTLTYADDGEATTPTYSAGVTGSNDTVTYGTDVTFTIDPGTGTSVQSVYYTVGGSNSTQLIPSDGTYTIDGSSILGDIAITVTAKKYYTITFQQGTGNAMTAITGYVWDNEAGIYTSVPNNEDAYNKALSYYSAADITNGLTAESGYRLKDETAGESLWNDDTSDYTTAYIIGQLTFTADTTFTAQSVKTYVVTFTSGGNGSVNTSELTVDTGSTFTVPSVTPNSSYSFKEWQIDGSGSYSDNDIAAYNVTSDITVTAIFEPSKYAVTLADSDYGTFAAVSGIEDGYGTYLTDIVFTFTTTGGTVVENVYYSVDGGEKIALSEDNGTYTIDGSSVTGTIVISFETTDTYVYTFASADTDKGTVSGTTGFVLNSGDKLTETQFGTVVKNAKTGYSFKEWQISEDDVLSGGAVVVPTDVAAERDLTFKAVFELTNFTVTDENSAVDIIDGSLENGYAHMGTDITFTINDDYVVSYVAYKIGDGNEVQIIADSETGIFTIPGSVITDNVTIVTTVIMQPDPSDPSGETESDNDKAAAEFIFHDEYVGQSITAAAGRKILVVNAAKLASGNYALTGYGEFFYSEEYGAYVIWVNEDETAVTVKGKLTMSANDPVIIDYSGDTNGTGIVTAGDAGMINDILKNQWNYTVTDEQLFKLDVEQTGDGYQMIKTSDVVWVLNESIGLN